MSINKKRVISFSAAFAMFFSVLSFHHGSTAMTVEAAFEKNAQETVDDMTFGWNLGNTFDCYSGTAFGAGSLATENSWGNPTTTKEMINMVKDTGIDTIRVPVTWYNHMDPNTYKIDDAWMNRVEEVVNYVLDEDTYCIINVHHDTGENGWLRASTNNLEKNEEIFTAIWKQISERFADYGDHLLFEGFNELLNDSNEWVNPDSTAVDVTNELNQIFVDTVRKSGGNNDKRNLICMTYCAGGNSAVTQNFKLPNDTADNRLIVEAHVYQPFYFTSESAPNVTTWDSVELDKYLGNMYNQFVKNGIPVIIGEFGCVDKGNADQRLSWAQYYVESCHNYGMPCIWWDNGNEYKLFNRRTLKITEPELLNTMLAEAMGQKYTPDTTVKGDVNGDGVCNISDAVVLQRWLLAVPDVELANWKAADLCEDERIDVFDLCLLKRKLTEKENLCANEDNWNSWIDTTNGAEGEMLYTENGIVMNIVNGGLNDWDAQASYQNLTFEQGATYQISFDYKSSVPQTLSFHAMQNYGDYKPYYSASLDYSTEAQHFEDTFTMKSATDKKCEITFNFGGSIIAGSKIDIANLRLVKISEGTVVVTPEPGVTEDENICADDNWTSWINEEGGAAASVEYLGDGIQVTVTKSGAEEWYIQGSYPDITLEEGAEYRISFDYSADKEVPLWYHVQQNYDPYGQYIYEQLNFSIESQHYSSTFTMTEKTDRKVVFVLNCGGVDDSVPFTVTLKNLSIVKIS